MEISHKREVEAKIEAINHEFRSRWGRYYFKGASSSDVHSLEQTLVTVKIVYRLSFVVAQIFTLLLVGLSLIKFVEFNIPIDLNKLGILIIFAVAFIINAYRTYKVMVNLEIKILLLKIVGDLS
jgi:uncharacterized membrane protein